MAMNDYQSNLQWQISKLKSVRSDYRHNNIITVLADTKTKFPVEEQIKAHFRYINKPYRLVDFKEFSYVELCKRTQWYINILTDEINYLQDNSDSNALLSENAMQLFYINPPQFSDTYVLYKENGNEFKVADMLSVIGYAQKIYETAGGKVDEKSSIALQALHGIDLILHNKPQDKPFNKTLHILNDTLTEVAKNTKMKSMTDSNLSGISLLIDLAIDFLVKS